MPFDRSIYQVSRGTPLQTAKKYLEARKKLFEKSPEFKGRADMHEKKEAVKKLKHADLLIVQSSSHLWHELLADPDYLFRRIICKNAHRLTQMHVMHELSYSSTGSANTLFSMERPLDFIKAYKIGIFSNVPWQVVNNKDPDELSYSEFAEYTFPGVAKKVSIKELGAERSQVLSIAGYVITDPQAWFPQESSPVTGRWVTTFPEMDYFEFHLNHEPVLDKNTVQQILNIFPSATDLITTYLPFRKHKRSLWIITPRSGKKSGYETILHELREYRDETRYQQLQK